MPELPEVEVLVRHLRRLLRGQTILKVHVQRAKVVAPDSARRFTRILHGAQFKEISRRGKYLLFELKAVGCNTRITLVGHLGMTGRMYLVPRGAPLPKHVPVWMSLGREDFIFEDTRYFGRLTLDTTTLARLGPEPLDSTFTPEDLARGIHRSEQPIKVKLLDQSVVAGVGNIYASEALFRAGISPRTAARRLGGQHVETLWRAIREVLAEAIDCGSTVPLNLDGARSRDGLFYFGRAVDAPDFYEERLRVYDRAGQPCLTCRTPIRRLVQAARSTYYCPRCQA